MKKIIFLTLGVYVAAASSFCLAYGRVNPRGPLSVRNQMPLYLFWYAFPQEKAEVVARNKFSTAFDYTISNVVMDKVTNPTEEWIVRADMEVNRYNLNLKYGVFENLEADLEIPYIVLSKGYLDSFVEEFEDFIGATAVGARKRTSKYQFNYNLQHNSKNLINTQTPSDGIGDIALSLKYMLIEEVGNLPRTSLRGAIKFPTASKAKFLGTEEFDYGLGILLDKSFSRLFTYFNFSTVFIDKPDFLSEMDIKNFLLSSMFALEYCFTERASGIMQGTWHSTPYPTTGTDPLDNDAVEIGLGFNYQLTQNSNWHIAVIENGYADSTPDVTFQTGGRIKF